MQAKKAAKRTLRMRVFAGPNGSGKSTMYRQVSTQPLNGRLIDLGVYVNPDDISKALREKGFIDLKDYALNPGSRRYTTYLKSTTLIPSKLTMDAAVNEVHWEGAVMFLKKNDNVDRIAQLLTQFICAELMRTRKKFSFETVFSDPSKLQVMEQANKLGYKTYLYFISTNDPVINKDRVRLRVKQGGHDVPERTIEDRYYRSLRNLLPAIKLAYHAFVYDNTRTPVMFAEYKLVSGQPTWWFDRAKTPEWFIEYYMNAEGSKSMRNEVAHMVLAKLRLKHG